MVWSLKCPIPSKPHTLHRDTCICMHMRWALFSVPPPSPLTSTPDLHSIPSHP